MPPVSNHSFKKKLLQKNCVIELECSGSKTKQNKTKVKEPGKKEEKKRVKNNA